MANTFKQISKSGVTSADVIYTVAGSTTTVVLGLIIGNTQSSDITVTLTIETDTANRSGSNNEANQNVELLTSTTIPANSSLEIMQGNKIVLETTDVVKLTASAAADISISVMEIT